MEVSMEKFDLALIGFSYCNRRQFSDDGSQRVLQPRRLWIHHIERRVGAFDDAGTRIFLFWTCSKKVCTFLNSCLRYGILRHLIPVVFLGLQCTIL
jgi:hypothetical protein